MGHNSNIPAEFFQECGFGANQNYATHKNMIINNTDKTEGVNWVGKAELAAHLKCSPRHINNLMRRRILPYIKAGRFVRFDLADCDRAMRKLQVTSWLDDPN